MKWTWVLPVVLTVIIILSWIGMPMILKIGLVLFAIYRFIKIAAEKFLCPNCMIKFMFSIGLLVLGFVQLPGIFYAVGMAAIWLMPFINRYNSSNPTF